jgi:hypothetical protein
MNRVPTLLACALLAASAAAQAPSNNSCSSPLTVFAGVNPQPPNGASGQFFTNVGASNSSSTAFDTACATAFNKDVWFEFTPTRTGTHTIKTCTPSGFTSGSLSETVVAIYDGATCPSGGTELACNDDNTVCNIFGSSRSSMNVSLWDGQTYLIRVGTESATASGTFYLEIEIPATAANDTCSNAVDLVIGANAGSFDGSNTSSLSYACTNFSVDHTDVWFKYEGSLADAINGVEVAITESGAGQFMAVYSGSCPSILGGYTLVDCGTSVVQFAPTWQTYWIRVGRGFSLEPTLTFTLTMTKTNRPSNDHCSNGLGTTGGVGPFYAETFGYYDNSGALDTDFGAIMPVCLAFSNSDVWYDYIATSSGKVVVSTDNYPGYPVGTLTDTVIAVFSACPNGSSTDLIACDDDGGVGNLSRLVFDAVQGTHYKVMVAGYGANGNTEGQFTLQILPQFRLQMSSPSGAGSFQLNLFDGGPNNAFFTCLTLNQGIFPYGPYFGIEPTFFEIVVQLTSNAPPFIGFLDGVGNYQYGPFVGLPSLTLYGVTMQFDALASSAGVTVYTAHTIP